MYVPFFQTTDRNFIYQNDADLSNCTAEENQSAESTETFEEKIYKEISLINGRINRMDLNQLKMACKDVKLDCHGSK